jgi:23S rRNA pseudouridine1911/1915/1917 synthase
LLVLNKWAGLLVQGDISERVSLIDLAKNYLKISKNKPGDAYCGLIHRLDFGVSGVIVFGKTSKASGRICEQFKSEEKTRKLAKIYYAIVEGSLRSNDQLLTNFLVPLDR